VVFIAVCVRALWKEVVVELTSKTPINLGKVGKKKLNVEIIRTAMSAELDAISLYEQLSAQTDDVAVKGVLLDVAREEKTHFGEFQEMLLRMDSEQVKELEKAREEVKQFGEK